MKPKDSFIDNPIIIYLFFFIIFLLTLTSNFTGPHDSMTYLQMLRTREHLWHPHHLLYHQLSYYWLHLLKLVFPGLPDYFLVESFSSVFGAGTITVVYLFFRNRFNLPTLTCWLGCAIVAFSYGIWFYSINVEVYAPSLFLTICCFYILAKKEWSARDVWLAAFLHSFAILFHQMNILFTPIVLYKIIEQRKNIFVLKSIFWYALTGLVLVGGVYVLAGRFGEGHRDLESWITWIRGYTTSDEYWRSLSMKTPVMAGVGFTHTILGGHFLFRMGLERWFTSLLHSHSLQDEMFLVKDMPQSVGMLMFVLTILLVALTVFLLFRFISRIRSLIKTEYYIIVPLILYFLIYSCYFLFWMPEILEFWLGQCVVFWLLLIGTYQPAGRRLNLVLALILALLLIINYTSSIRPMDNINHDIGYARIQKVKQAATANDLVIVQDPWLLKEFLEYYTPAQVARGPEKKEQVDSLQRQIRRRLDLGNKVFLFPSEPGPHASRNYEFIPAVLNEYKNRSTLLPK